MSSAAVNGAHFGNVRLHQEDDEPQRARKPGSRLLRTLRLLEFLQSGRVCNSGELAEFCGVSRRTVFRDIATLQEAGIAVMHDTARGGYFIPHRRASARPDLTLPEAVALQIACHATAAQLGLPDAAAAAGKVCGHLPKSVQDSVKALSESIVVQPECQTHAGDATVFPLCLDALRQRRRLQVSLVEPAALDAIDGYRLLYADNAWHLVGCSALHREVRCYPLKTLRNPMLLDQSYLVPLKFSLDRYLGNAWSIARELPARQVAIVFDAAAAADVAASRWHKTQELRWLDDGRLEFRAEVDGLDEIAAWILRFGPEAEVLEPPQLRSRIADTVEAMRRKYAAT